MIHLDRSRIPRPKLFDEPRFRDFLDRLREFQHTEGGSRKTQRRFPLEKELYAFREEAMGALHELFHGKCAYTEERLGKPPGVLHFHRPPADAIGLDQDVSPEHYWWLVGEWSNWVLASERVQSIKGTQFPVVGERAKPEAAPGEGGDEVDLGLLLDPCRDQPAWWLEFRDDGTVVPREHPSPAMRERYGGASRGELTIRLLDLGNDHLVRGRRGAAGNILLESGAFDPRLEFSAARRQQCARELVAELRKKHRKVPLWQSGLTVDSPDLAQQLAHEIGAELLLPRSELPEVDREWSEPVARAILLECPDLADDPRVRRLLGEGPAMTIPEPPPAPSPRPKPAPPAVPVLDRSARIAEIRIKNFKAIADASLSISADPVTLPAPWGSEESDLSGVSWTALLGENGCGKSCFLQALGLALAGEHLGEVLEETGLEWSRLLRRGESQGRISLRFLGGAQVDLRFNERKHWWVGGEPQIRTFIRGYGATRLLEGGPALKERLQAPVRVANLFDPRAPVIDAKSWLLGLAAGDFNAAALTLGDFLRRGPMSPAGPEQETRPLVQREGGDILVDDDRLEDVSDGYRAIIAMVCDILGGLGAGLSDMRHALGIVLIDEIGAHLHPRWRMEISAKLRRALPNLQFLVSTHEPLCLRGLFGNEVVRVRKTSPPGDPRPESRRVTLEPVERSPSDFRVDQLLTSEFFGLDTTVDPDLDRRFQAYYRLLAMSDAERTPERTVQLQTLREELHRRSSPALGHTRRDQLVYEAIDLYLSCQDRLDPEARRAERQKTLERVQEIWRARRSIGGAGTRP